MHKVHGPAVYARRRLRCQLSGRVRPDRPRQLQQDLPSAAESRDNNRNAEWSWSKRRQQLHRARGRLPVLRCRRWLRVGMHPVHAPAVPPPRPLPAQLSTRTRRGWPWQLQTQVRCRSDANHDGDDGRDHNNAAACVRPAARKLPRVQHRRHRMHVVPRQQVSDPSRGVRRRLPARVR